MPVAESTRVRALKEAKSLMQEFGYNGFSFQHIADALGIKKPSLYEHFASKEELGQELIEDYIKGFLAWGETIAVFAPADKVGALFERFYNNACNSGKYCILSAFTGDFNALPKSIKKPLIKAYEMQRSWMKSVIEEGQKKKIFRADFSAEELSLTVISMALGSQLVGRVSEDPEKIKIIKAGALKLIRVE